MVTPTRSTGCPGGTTAAGSDSWRAAAGVAAGCTIVVDGQGADGGTGWTTAGALTTGADEIHTRFSRTMRTVAVALTGAVGTDVERTRIDIVGGRLATDRDGTTRRPAVVTLATTSVLVYDVIPDRGADAVTVAVTPGSDWTVTAVLGAGGPNEPRVSVDRTRRASGASVASSRRPPS